MRLTAKQLADLQALISRHFSALVVNVVGPNAVTEETLKILQAAGLVRPQIEGVKQAFLAGILSQKIKEKGVSTPLKEIKRHLASNPVPLGLAEKQAIHVAEMQAATYIRGLGDKVKDQFGQKVLTQNRRALARAAQYRGKVREATARAIENRKSISQLVSDLGHMNNDFSRDLHRVANTEIAAAMNQGRLAEAVAKDGADTRVFFIVAPNACDWCRSHLLERGTNKPIIFKMSKVAPNGTNVGRKIKDWKVQIPPIHPNCSCTLTRCAPGLTVDDEGNLVPK